MPAPKARSDYDQLNRIQQLLMQQAEASNASLRNLQRAKDTLQGGDWIGQGAKVFYREMDSEVLPSMKRLAAALERAAGVVGKMSQTIKSAEEEASKVFKAVGAAAWDHRILDYPFRDDRACQPAFHLYW